MIYGLEAARVINGDPDADGGVEVAAWCDEEGHFGHFLGSRSYIDALAEDDIDAARDRNHDGSRCARRSGAPGLPAARA